MTFDENDIDDGLSRCEALGHQDEQVVAEDDEYLQFWCYACGAEWEEKK